MWSLWGWSAPLYKLYSKVIAKTVHTLGMSLLCWLIGKVCGLEGPGVEFKVHLMSLWQSRERKFLKHMQQHLVYSQTHLIQVYTYYTECKAFLFWRLPRQTFYLPSEMKVECDLSLVQDEPKSGLKENLRKPSLIVSVCYWSDFELLKCFNCALIVSIFLYILKLKLSSLLSFSILTAHVLFEYKCL